MRKIVILLMLMLMGKGVSFCQESGPWPIEVKAWNGSITLTIENEPKIGEETILRLSVGPYSGEEKEVDITCDIPKEWEFINVEEYRIDKYYIKGEPNSRCRHCEYENIETGEEGYYKKTPEGKYRGYCKYVMVHLWEGYMEQGEKKEFILKVRIPDGKRNEIFCFCGGYEHFEFDLGELDQPNWPYLNRRKWRGTEVKDGKRLVCTDTYEVTPNIRKREVLVDEGELPPILSELMVRTKYIPYISPYFSVSYNPPEIPLRYLVSTNIEAKEIMVTVRINEEFEFIDEGNYVITKKNGYTYIKLYQGPMQAKETKAFYFKVRVSELAKDDFGTGEAAVLGEIKLLTPDGRELETTDRGDVDF